MAAPHADTLRAWSGYHRKPVAERRALLGAHLRAVGGGEEASAEALARLDGGGLRPETAEHMVENCVGVLGLPLAVAPTFVINGAHTVVPMSVEEPSVVAAASGAAKLVALGGGGFEASCSGSVMTGQVQVLDLPGGAEAAAAAVDAAAAALVDAANEHCASMKRRGGGVLAVRARVVRPRAGEGREPYLAVHFDLDAREAMGANIVNTVAEGLAPHVARVTGGRVALRILTNLCTGRLARATFRVPLEALAWKGTEGRLVAERVLEAYHFAADCPFRAATHNKGIMNGVDAAAVAAGQDWRAIESAAHAYAAGAHLPPAEARPYAPLTRYWIEDGALCGRLEMPVAVGTVGGPLKTHPVYRLTLAVLGGPTASRLAQVLACVGLAQNFAALRALAVEGIQKGHMALHARNVAAAAGAPPELVAEVADHMVRAGTVRPDAARAYLEARKEGAQQ